MQRLNMALQELKAGRSTTDVAFDSGYESLSGFGYTCKKLTGFAPSAQRQVVLNQDATVHERRFPMTDCRTLLASLIPDLELPEPR